MDLPPAGIDLEEERVLECRHRVYLRTDVQHMPLVGLMVLTLLLPKAKSQGKCATIGLVIVVTGQITSRLLTADCIMFTN